MATVLTSMDATTVLAGEIDVPTGSYSILIAGPPIVDIHTGSDVVPTASPIVAPAIVVTPYSRRKGKEVMSTEKTMDQKAEEGLLYDYDQKQLKVEGKRLQREDLNQLWVLVKEYLSIRPASSDKEMELWVELKRLYEPDAEDQLEEEACPTDSGFIADQDRATIAKSSTLSNDIAPRVTSPAAVEGNTKEMGTVLTSIDAATVLAGGIDVPTGSCSIPTAGPPVVDIYTGSDVVPTAKFPLERRIELISDLVKYQDNYSKIYKFQSQQRRPWTKKQKKDYYMTVIKNILGWKVKDFKGWKVKDFKGMTFEEIEAKFVAVWKLVEDFIPMGSKQEAKRLKRKRFNLEQEKAKKQKTSVEVPDKEKPLEEILEEKVKEMMRLVPIEEVYVQALQIKHPIIDWKVHIEGQRSYWKIIRLGGSSTCYQFFVDLLKHLDREDLNQLWVLVKEYFSIRPASSDKEMKLWVELKRLYEPDPEDQLWAQTQNYMHAPIEWKLYDLSGVHHVTAKDKEIFMLVEKIILSEKV
nr:hypothetical protein [Tanacetum cinerariifolium]